MNSLKEISPRPIPENEGSVTLENQNFGKIVKSLQEMSDSS